ncbi:polyprenyl synthetase family protein [Actinocorallia sp. API 0066]|uniref:polyprenyl synthetase family protein n=1 Tax=Actinocorallia sp. API 0066 TaxID=2896846 RepID=UPI001E321403|nr:polyprenyl synthetase family protein [Actinocorallia sp. API 0066]MCD0450948.1 polyprenyl synthetase family protein [Actinocorallia sp. API 0066]
MTSSRVRKEVDEALYAFVDRQRPVLLAITQDLEPMLSALDSLLSGGKRLRPAFCYWGWRGAGGTDGPEVFTAAASLELLQASALIHDDVMDGSDTRRGQPSVHRRFEAMHAREGWPGSAESFGTGAAILLGDVTLAWSTEMYERSGLPEKALAPGRPLYDIMRTEVMCGQYLDMLEQARGTGDVESALRVVRYKSAKYTIERPLHLGAAMAGADAAHLDALSAYGLPLGAAFQLRDDVLGVFGDPTETGKPAGDDLREGKRTVLIALAMERGTPAQRATLNRRLGDPELDLDGVQELRAILTDTGALAGCERMIDEFAAEAHRALGEITLTPEARAALTDLAVAATARRV